MVLGDLMLTVLDALRSLDALVHPWPYHSSEPQAHVVRCTHNYYLLGWQFSIDDFHMNSFEIWLATTVVFFGFGYGFLVSVSDDGNRSHAMREHG